MLWMFWALLKSCPLHQSQLKCCRAPFKAVSVGHAHRVELLVLVQLLDLLQRAAQDVLVIQGPHAGLPEGSPTADLHADFRVSAESRSGDATQGLWLYLAGASAEAR